MIQGSFPGDEQGDVEALFFVLQPNETGATGSHQKGEIHVRRPQVGGALPDLSGPRETVNVELVLINAATAQIGSCVLTHYGGRRTTEDRLRRFPSGWRAAWKPRDLVVLIEAPGGHGFVYYHLHPDDALPEGLLPVARAVDAGASHGRVMLPRVGLS